MEKYLVRLKKELGKKEEMDFYKSDIKVSYESRIDPLLITVHAPSKDAITSLPFVEKATIARVMSLNV